MVLMLVDPSKNHPKKTTHRFLLFNHQHWHHMGVSLNGGTPRSSILIGFSIINHPFCGTTILGNPHIGILKPTPETNSASQEALNLHRIVDMAWLASNVLMLDHFDVHSPWLAKTRGMA